MAKVKINKRPVGRPAKILDPMIDWMVDVGEWIGEWMIKNDRTFTGDSSNFHVTAIQNPLYVELSSDVDYLPWATQGRKSGEAPSPYIIKDWLDNKGKKYFPGADEKTLNSIAFGISKNIAKRGTSSKTKKLRIQNIQLVIKQKGIKHTKKLADNLAKDIAAETLKGFGKIN